MLNLGLLNFRLSQSKLIIFFDLWHNNMHILVFLIDESLHLVIRIKLLIQIIIYFFIELNILLTSLISVLIR